MTKYNYSNVPSMHPLPDVAQDMAPYEQAYFNDLGFLQLDLRAQHLKKVKGDLRRLLGESFLP